MARARPVLPAVQPMILLHVVWMTRYSGWEPKIHAAGFKFPATHGWGAEMFNFKDEGGKYYGHVEIMPRTIKGKEIETTLHLENLGATKTATNKRGILVVWTAPDPRRPGRTIIGWYKNATLYRSKQKPEGMLARDRTYDTEICSYRVVADHHDSILLLPDHRKLTIPPKKQGTRNLPGQFNAYYPQMNGETGATWEARIRRFIDNHKPHAGRAAPAARARRHSQDALRRKTIEQAAVDFVWTHFEDELGYEITNRQDDQCGYDLLAERDGETLCIEVKGRSGREVNADFSRNEYEKIILAEKRKFQDGSYRICVVTDALAKPKLHHFMHWPGVEGGASGWWTNDGVGPFEFKPVMAARGSMLRPMPRRRPA